MRPPIIGVILAGGLGRRMGGRDKALLPLGGKPLLAHVASRLGPQVDAVVISANGDVSRFAPLGLPVVADASGDHPGPLAGLLAGMDWALAHRPDATRIATAAADTPFFPADLVGRLLAAAGDAGQIVVASSASGTHPVFGLWPISLAGEFRAHLEHGGRKVRDFASAHAARTVAFEAEHIGGTAIDPFFNINTPADLDEAEALCSRQGSSLP